MRVGGPCISNYLDMVGLSGRFPQKLQYFLTLMIAMILIMMVAMIMIIMNAVITIMMVAMLNGDSSR